MKFEQWFISKLKVDRFPLPGEITKSDYQYIINVSDEHIGYCMSAAAGKNIKYFWFPMSECSGDIGLNSIYGALQILFIAEQEGAKVLLHCHAGVNRSGTVRDAYYFLRTKKHRAPKILFLEVEEWLLNSQENTDNLTHLNKKNNRLIENIEQGNLPSIRKMEKFLINCDIQFQKEETSKGGCLDWSKLKADIHT